MNREIKFRAWDTKEKRYWDEDTWSMCTMSINLDGSIQVWDSYYNGCEADLILEQYTGLKDKNGVEIYCGDKLTTHRWKNVEDKINGHVRFEHGAFVIGEGSISLFALWLAQDVFEIIGTIHQEDKK